MDKNSLRKFWFEKLEQLHSQAQKLPSQLDCASLCTARCCPQAKAQKSSDYAIGHVAIMLPFEMEYILEKTQTSIDLIQTTSLEYAPGVFIDIGFVTNETPCPFLTKDYQCGIHDIRPLDCRSFPLIPVFDLNDTLSFRSDETCPSIHTFSKDFQEKFKKIWQELMSDLPMNYRTLYNEL